MTEVTFVDIFAIMNWTVVKYRQWYENCMQLIEDGKAICLMNTTRLNEKVASFNEQLNGHETCILKTEKHVTTLHLNQES